MMGTTMNRGAYKELIDEDIAAIPESMPKLEREHIIDVLNHSVVWYYETKPDLEAKLAAAKGYETLWRKFVSLQSGDATKLCAAAEENIALKAKLAEVEKDAERMDYLETKIVAISTPLVYGARTEFTCIPIDEEDSGRPAGRSNLRAAIDKEIKE